MNKLPQSSRYRPDFLAPGPHVAVQKDKPLSFDEARPEPNQAGTRDFQHKYYESDKILGQLYRAVDEQDIFFGVQKPALAGFSGRTRSSRSISLVLEKLWAHVQHQCQNVFWEQHVERAQGIREECVLLAPRLTSVQVICRQFRS
jgi:hypothetical protein